MCKEQNIKKCVFAGTFDPPTLGHKATVEDCVKLFDEVIIAVMINPDKKPCFSKEERAETVWEDGRYIKGAFLKIPNTANCFDNRKRTAADRRLTDLEVTILNFKEFFRLLCEDTEKGDRRPIFIAGLLECLPSGDEVRRVIAELLSLSRQLFFAAPRDLWPGDIPVKKFMLQHDNPKKIG